MDTMKHTPGPRLTEKRLRILKDAAGHNLGLVSRPYSQGFERVTWDRNAKALADAGMLAPYVHGGYEITDAGRAAIAKATGDPRSFAIEHDDFVGTVQGGYVTREGKRGVVLQQIGTRVMRVYGGLMPASSPREEGSGDA